MPNLTSTRNIRITSRDNAILDTLTRRVKFLTLNQIVRNWWTSKRSAMSRLSGLVADGLVEQSWLLTAPEVPLESPLATWRPSTVTPDFSTVLQMSRNRWPGPIRKTTVVLATNASAAMFCGHVGKPRISDATHDMHLSQVFLRMRVEDPLRASRWEGEAALYHRRNFCVPDAIISSSGCRTAIEVVGESYTHTKLNAFHEFCAKAQIGYEMW